MFIGDGTRSIPIMEPELPMNYNFTDRVRNVLAQARNESIRLAHDRVGAEHILLGLMRDREGVAAAVLHNRGIAREDVIREVEQLLTPGRSQRSASGELPYTSGAKKTLELAMGASRDLSHSYVGTEHLLLGVLREGSPAAGAVLARMGLSLDDARDEVARLLASTPERDRSARSAGESGGLFAELLRSAFGSRAAAPAAEPEPSFAVAIDEASSRSIYEQIVAQVQEAVATGRLRSGERLPAVRQMADQLDIAPGTVARAYGELERLGLVVTDGARGTRVAERAAPPPAAGRPEALAGLLRPVAVAAFHMGATARELRDALEEAMRGIFDGGAEERPPGG